MDRTRITDIAKAVCRRLPGLQDADKEDVEQDVALKLLQEWETIQTADDPEALAFIIARNCKLDCLRALFRNATIESLRDHLEPEAGFIGGPYEGIYAESRQSVPRNWGRGAKR